MEKEQFVGKIKNISKRVIQLKDSLSTEEATKTSLIMPFFQVLGYDVFNPMEFVPEYTADVGIKKGERVDYAIVTDSKLQMLIETKAINEHLTKHDSQLFRYFGTTDAKFAILTNGKEYEFFTDLDKPNKMDTTPFLTIDMTKMRDAQVSELFKFTKDNFDIDDITSTASELKYVTQVKNYLANEQENPSTEFTKLIMGNVYEGRRTENAVEDFKPIISKAIKQLITEKVNDKLSSALNAPVSLQEENPAKENNETTDQDSKAKSEPKDRKVETTSNEIEAYATVKVLAKDVIDAERITYRDNLSYFNVLIDDNIRKWVLRVYFSSSRNYIELNNETHDKLEFEHPTDLINFKKQINNVVKSFLQ